MTVMKRVVKPSTQSGKRALKNRAPKLVENEKKCLFINGQKTSEECRSFFKALHALKKTSSSYLSRKNEILPFEDPQKLEWLSKKHDAALFALTTHSKKRPNNVILGRMFNHQLLDMIELGVEDFRSMDQFVTRKVRAGLKPVLVFSGSGFTESPEHARLRSLLLDVFRGPTCADVCVTGLELAICFTSFQGRVFMRCYRISATAAGAGRRVSLEEIGPSCSLSLRRSRLADDDLTRTACRRPKELKPKKKKNVSRTPLGDTLGRVHMQKQDLGGLQTRKTPAIRAAKKAKLQEKKMEKQLLNAAKEL